MLLAQRYIFYGKKKTNDTKTINQNKTLTIHVNKAQPKTLESINPSVALLHLILLLSYLTTLSHPLLPAPNLCWPSLCLPRPAPSHAFVNFPFSGTNSQCT